MGEAGPLPSADGNSYWLVATETELRSIVYNQSFEDSHAFQCGSECITQYSISYSNPNGAWLPQKLRVAIALCIIRGRVEGGHRERELQLAHDHTLFTIMMPLIHSNTRRRVAPLRPALETAHGPQICMEVLP